MPPSKVPEMILAVGRAVLPAGDGNTEFAGPEPAVVVAALVVVLVTIVVGTVVLLDYKGMKLVRCIIEGNDKSICGY